MASLTTQKTRGGQGKEKVKREKQSPCSLLQPVRAMRSALSNPSNPMLVQMQALQGTWGCSHWEPQTQREFFLWGHGCLAGI